MSEWVDYQLAYYPTWLRGPWGTALGTLLGDAKQLLSDESSDATTARLVDVGPADALPLLGADRRVPRAPGESEADYRIRMLGAFDLHRQSGTVAGMIAAFVPLGVTATVVEDQAVGGALGHWARFAIVIDGTGVILEPAEWDAFAWDDGTRWDTSSGPEVDYMRAMIAQHKPARCRCVGILAFRDGLDPIVIPVDDVTIGYELADVVQTYLASYLPTWTVST